jgi:hypothetical protein
MCRTDCRTPVLVGSIAKQITLLIGNATIRLDGCRPPVLVFGLPKVEIMIGCLLIL